MGGQLLGYCAHHRENLVHVVNEIIEDLLNLDMEPKPESLWWTSSYEEEDQLTLKVGGRREGMGLAVQGGPRGTAAPFSTGRERHTWGRKDTTQRVGQLVARRLYLSFEKRFFEKEMPAE